MSTCLHLFVSYCVPQRTECKVGKCLVVRRGVRGYPRGSLPEGLGGGDTPHRVGSAGPTPRHAMAGRGSAGDTQSPSPPSMTPGPPGIGPRNPPPPPPLGSPWVASSLEFWSHVTLKFVTYLTAGSRLNRAAGFGVMTLSSHSVNSPKSFWDIFRISLMTRDYHKNALIMKRKLFIIIIYIVFMILFIILFTSFSKMNRKSILIFFEIVPGILRYPLT